MDDKLQRYEVLEILAKLANYRGVSYEVDEMKDGRILSIKNVKIERIELKND
jgi:hypothetical protein